MNAVNKEAIEGYFDLLEETLKHCLMNSRITWRESDLPLDSRPPNAIAKQQQKKV